MNRTIIWAALAIAIVAMNASAWTGLGPKWPGADPMVSYFINEQGCEEVPDEWVPLQKSFKVWEVPTTAISTDYKGTTSVNTVSPDKKNIVKWAYGSDWDLGGNVIGATYYWYDGATLIDFDIVFNGRNYKWSTTGEKGKMDVGHIATHEVGHALGLGHSSVAGAVMWPSAVIADTSHRRLSPDDSIGITTLYPRTIANNHPPVITSTPVTEAIAGAKYAYAVTARDDDGDTIRYALQTFPLNMRIDSITGMITWFPKFLDIGAHDVVVIARDKMNGIGRQTFKVNVSNLVVYTGNKTVTAGDTFYYDVKVTPMDDYGILAGNIEISFNRREAVILGIDTVGSILKNISLASNFTADTLKVAFAAPGTFSGEGVLFRMRMTVLPDQCGRQISVHLKKAFFNDGNPVAVTRDGIITCIGAPGAGKSIEGWVTYAGNTRGVGGATVRLEETRQTVTTAHNGGFSIPQVPLSSTAYTIAVSKDSGDLRTAVSAYDASLILRHVVGLVKLDAYASQKECADVNGNKLLTAYDAALILRFIVGINDATDIGTWVLIPPKKTLPSFLQPVTNLGFNAYVVGDVSGNWGDTTGALPKGAVASAGPSMMLNTFTPVPVQAGSGTVQGYRAVVSVANAGFGVYSGQFEINLGTSSFILHSVAPLPLLDGFITAANAAGETVRFAFASTAPMPASGDLAQIVVIPASDHAGDLSLDKAAITFNMLNERSATAIRIGRGGAVATIAGLVQKAGVYPNPFIRSVKVEFSVLARQNITVMVYDLRGNEVIRLASGVREPGLYTVNWDGRDGMGRDLSSRIYVVRFVCGDYVKAVKVQKVR